MRSAFRRIMSRERGAADDLPEHHDGPQAGDLTRSLPPGGAGATGVPFGGAGGHL
jgi:hypothetical protein